MYATGAAELRRIARSCRTASGHPVAKNIADRMDSSPAQLAIQSEVVRSVIAKLPRRGKLNAWVADSSIRISSRAGGSQSVTTVTVSKSGHDLQGLDGGLVIHPDNRFRGGYRPGGAWFSQPVTPLTISDPIVDEGGNQLEVAVEIAAALLAERIVRA